MPTTHTKFFGSGRSTGCTGKTEKMSHPPFLIYVSKFSSDRCCYVQYLVYQIRHTRRMIHYRIRRKKKDYDCNYKSGKNNDSVKKLLYWRSHLHRLALALCPVETSFVLLFTKCKKNFAIDKFGDGCPIVHQVTFLHFEHTEARAQLDKCPDALVGDTITIVD